MRIGTVLAVAAMVTAAASIGRAADRGAAAVGVVDVEAVFKAHPKAASLKAVLQKQKEEFDAERDDMKKEMDRLKADLEAAAAEADDEALSDAKRKEKRKVVEQKLAAAREYERKTRETLGMRQQEAQDQQVRIRKQLLDDIRGRVKQCAEKQNVALVVDAAVALYWSDAIDLTPQVVKLLGGDAAAAAAPPPDKGK